MRVNDVTLDVCVSCLQGYDYKPNDNTKQVILEVNKVRKYVRLYLLDKHMGYISKRDTPNVLMILNNINGYRRVNKWSVVTKTNHYLIIRLHLSGYPKYNYYIYQLSFENSPDMYIGSTKNLPQRIKEHKKQLQTKTHPNKRLQQAYDTNNANMTVSILFTDETNKRQIQFQKEQEFILQYQPSLNMINSYKIICECGRNISYRNIKNHENTKYHIKRIVTNVVNEIIEHALNNVIDDIRDNACDNISDNVSDSVSDSVSGK